MGLKALAYIARCAWNLCMLCCDGFGQIMRKKTVFVGLGCLTLTPASSCVWCGAATTKTLSISIVYFILKFIYVSFIKSRHEKYVKKNKLAKKLPIVPKHKNYTKYSNKNSDNFASWQKILILQCKILTACNNIALNSSSFC